MAIPCWAQCSSTGPGRAGLPLPRALQGPKAELQHGLELREAAPGPGAHQGPTAPSGKGQGPADPTELSDRGSCAGLSSLLQPLPQPLRAGNHRPEDLLSPPGPNLQRLRQLFRAFNCQKSPIQVQEIQS